MSRFWVRLGDGYQRLGARFLLALLAISTLVLLVAMASEVARGDKPCVLCISQRYPFVVALVLGAISYLFYRNVILRVLLLAVITIAFCYGLSVGGYQVGAEWGWWSNGALCGATVIGTGGASGQASGGAWGLAAPVLHCEDSAWTLMGISMAGYNVLLSSALALLCGLATWFSFHREA